VTIAANCLSFAPQAAHIQAGMISTSRVGILLPSVVIQTRSSRAGHQVRLFRSGYPSTLSSPTALSRLLSYSVASPLSHRAPAFTQFSLGRLHRYLHRWTQNSLRVGAKAAVYLGGGSEISLRGVKATIRGHATQRKFLTVKPGAYSRGCRLILLVATALALDWLAIGTIVRTHTRTNRRVINASPSPQSETKSGRLEANPENDPVQDFCGGVPLSDRATTGTTQQLLHGSSTSFLLSVPWILLTFHLAALQNVLCPEFASAQTLRDANLHSSSQGWNPTKILRSLFTRSSLGW
jgi:hypothetical protein